MFYEHNIEYLVIFAQLNLFELCNFNQLNYFYNIQLNIN